MFDKPKREQNRALLNRIKMQRCWIGEGCIGPTDPHHITTVKAGGADTADNVIPLCRNHHAMVHAIGHSKFAQRFPAYQRWLELMDRWDILNKF